MDANKSLPILKKEIPLLYKEEVYKIVGAAMEVHNQLGCGFLEAIYIDTLTSIDKSQALNYLKATGLELALLINFGAPTLAWERIVLTRPKNSRSFVKLA